MGEETKQMEVKPGVKTTEFWIASVVAVVGAVMAFLPAATEGDPTILEIVRQICGAVMSAGAAMGYGVSRGLAKQGAKTIKILVVAFMIGIMIGCCTVPAQSVKQIESTHNLILPEYIQYIEADTSLDSDEKDDAKKLAGSLERLVDALKKHTED